MRKFKNWRLFLLVMGSLMFNSARIIAQDGVSIGSSTPHPNATLHVQPPANNGGLLIPRLTTLQRNGITISNTPDSAEGLMVYDTDINSFYFYDGHWQRLGTPQGGIIMWSGAPPPKGWVLCDGRRYDTNGLVVGSGGILTPDLKGRFIVGYNGSNTSYNQPGNRSTGGITAGKTGGLPAVTLNTSQIPSHNHGINLNTNVKGLHNHPYTDKSVKAPYREGDPGNRGGQIDGFETKIRTTSSSGNHFHNVSGNTATVGGGLAHENRPPYYVLAFIMKL